MSDPDVQAGALSAAGGDFSSSSSNAGLALGRRSSALERFQVLILEDFPAIFFSLEGELRLGRAFFPLEEPFDVRDGVGELGPAVLGFIEIGKGAAEIAEGFFQSDRVGRGRRRGPTIC